MDLTMACRQALSGSNFAVVDIQAEPAEDALVVYIRRSDGVQECVNDCTEVSKILNTSGDFERHMSDISYLDVSTRGLEPPLVWPEDFKNVLGKTVWLRLNDSREIEGVVSDILDGEGLKIDDVLFSVSQLLDAKCRFMADGG